jgi:hypothetical protein
MDMEASFRGNNEVDHKRWRRIYMSGRMYAGVLNLSLVLLLSGLGCAGVLAANPGPGDINMNDLSILEHRFFSHAYGHDPAEKRLERLECLVFGSTRDGSNTERMARLMKTVAARSQQPLAQEKPAVPAPAPASEEKPRFNKPPASSKQYPVLNTLEWKTLKKTYPDESLDQRLDRLESKMFGQPAQTMAYIDRVERLKKTLGIGLTPEPADGITARGPMPKALPRGGDNGAGVVPLEGFMPPSLGPNLGGIDPFGDTAFGGIRQLQQMMQNFDKRMSDMRNSGTTRTWIYDPDTQQWVEQSQGTKKKSAPGQPAKPKVTTPGDDTSIREVPGYADPNSI